MKNQQKGFIVPLLIIIAVLIIGGGLYIYSKPDSNLKTFTESPTTQSGTTTTNTAATSSATINATTTIQVKSPQVVVTPSKLATGSSTVPPSSNEFLVPAKTSIPVPYQLFLSHVQGDSYTMQYNNGDDRFLIAEYANTNDYNYQSMVAAQEENGSQKIKDFTYEGSAGVILRTKDRYGDEDDQLIWQDGSSRWLEIDNSFNVTQNPDGNTNFSADYLINILKTFVRSPLSSQSHTGLNPVSY